MASSSSFRNCEVDQLPATTVARNGPKRLAQPTSSPGQQRVVARRQVLAAAAGGSSVASLQKKTPSSSTKAYRQYLAANSHQKTSRQGQVLVPSRRALLTVKGVIDATSNNPTVHISRLHSFPEPPKYIEDENHAHSVTKELTLSSKRAVLTCSILKSSSHSKYKYPRTRNAFSYTDGIKKRRLSWWDDTCGTPSSMQVTVPKVESKSEVEAVRESPLQSHEASVTSSTLMFSPSTKYPPSIDAEIEPFIYDAIEPLALHLDTSEDEGASSSSIGIVDDPGQEACSFIPWVVKVASPAKCSKALSVLELLDKNTAHNTGTGPNGACHSLPKLLAADKEEEAQVTKKDEDMIWNKEKNDRLWEYFTVHRHSPDIMSTLLGCSKAEVEEQLLELKHIRQKWSYEISSPSSHRPKTSVCSSEPFSPSTVEEIENAMECSPNNHFDTHTSATLFSPGTLKQIESVLSSPPLESLKPSKHEPVRTGRKVHFSPTTLPASKAIRLGRSKAKKPPPRPTRTSSRKRKPTIDVYEFLGSFPGKGNPSPFLSLQSERKVPVLGKRRRQRK